MIDSCGSVHWLCTVIIDYDWQLRICPLTMYCYKWLWLTVADLSIVSDVFRQIDFGPDPQGRGRLMVFQLLANPSYYLATTHVRHLEIQVRTAGFSYIKLFPKTAKMWNNGTPSFTETPFKICENLCPFLVRVIWFDLLCIIVFLQIFNLFKWYRL